MSSIARWSYQNVATVWPYLGADDWNGGNTYGKPYQIACGWIGGAKQGRDADGAEYVVLNTFFTEASSSGATYTPVRVPVMLDRIAKGTHIGTWQDAAAEEIRDVKDYEMAAFGDTTDYEIVT